MSAALIQPQQDEQPAFMSVRQVADYLQLNEKKIYSLLKEGKIPGTKITGKWLFPRELIDRWILDSSHGGVLTDRLIISGSDDPLLYRVILGYAQQTRARALVTYSPTGTRLGLELLQAHRVDACGLHWGPEQEAHLRHPALLAQYTQHRNWVLVRAFRRRQGIMLARHLQADGLSAGELLERAHRQRLRWIMRQPGAGAQRFLLDILIQNKLEHANFEQDKVALSEREAAATIATGQGDLAPGAEAAAVEFGLDFIPLGWEAFDLVLPRQIYFRSLFQDLLTTIRTDQSQEAALMLRGYDLEPCGTLVWSAE